MAKKGESGVYRVTEVIGTSSNSWEDAAKNAVQTAAGTIRDLRIAEITKLDMRLEEGKVIQKDYEDAVDELSRTADALSDCLQKPPPPPPPPVPPTPVVP